MKRFLTVGCITLAMAATTCCVAAQFAVARTVTPVRHAAAQSGPQPSLVINDGGPFANSRTAILHCSGLFTLVSFREDAGQWTAFVPASPEYLWTLSNREGLRTISARFLVGRPVPIEASAQVTLDLDSPTVTMTGVDDDWHCGETDVDIQASDWGSGLASASYQIDDGPWQPLAAGAVPVTGDGVHVVACRAVDEAGNGSGRVVRGTVKIDTAPPVTWQTGGGDPAYLRHATLRFSATDGGNGSATVAGVSGVAETEFRLDGGDWTAGDVLTIGSRKKGPPAEGDHVVEYRSTDAAGNVEQARSTVVHIDSQPPVTGCVVPVNRSATPVTLTLLPTDAGSGVAATFASLDGGPWLETTTVTVPAAPDGSDDGLHVISFYSVDGAGHAEGIQRRTLSIYTGPDYEGGALTAYNPYVALPGTAYKGQLHTHSVASDGTASVAAMAERYRDLGYDFVVATDHDALATDPALPGILWIPGVEETAKDLSEGYSHMTQWPAVRDDPSRQMQTLIDDAEVAILAHPHYHDSRMPGGGITTEEAVALHGYDAIEIWNALVAEHDATDLWDVLLSQGRRVFGVAVDDAHSIDTAGRTFVMVYAEECTQPAIVAAVHEGRFYASRGPLLTLDVTDTTFSVSSPEACDFAFIAGGGRVVGRVDDATEASYTYTGHLGYVRCVATRVSDGLQAWTNAIQFAQ